MPFEEKMTWVSVVVGFLVPLGYFAAVMPQLGDTPAADIAYQGPLIVAFVATIVLMIIGAVVMAIGTAVGAQIEGTSPVDRIERSDERDAQISRRGDAAGYYVASGGAVIVLIITMLEYEYFWIASLVYLSVAAATLVSSAIKLHAYRRGF